MKSIAQFGILLIAFLSNHIAYAYDFEVDGIYYDIISLEDLTCKVVSGDNKYSGEIIIPSTVNYKNRQITVISIGEAFYYCNELLAIELPNSITSIDDSAFEGCSKLTSIKIPNSITRIGRQAFWRCSELEAIELPNSVTSIGEKAFFECCKLATIELPNSVTSIGEKAFFECCKLAKIELPNSVTSIGPGAFSNCSKLTTITLPNSLNYLGGGVFENCTSLTSITLPNNWKTIPYETFCGCKSLSSIDLPDSVTEIGGSAFERCRSMKYIRSTSQNEIKISKEAFRNCESLVAVDFVIGDIDFGAFMNCSSLTSLTIGKAELCIRHPSFIEDSFFGCDKIKELKIIGPISLYELYSETGRIKKRSLTWHDLPFKYAERVFLDSYAEVFSLPKLQELTLGKNIKEGPSLNICWRLETIFSLAVLPPELPECTNKQYMDLIVKVPKEALEAYKNAPVWKNFWNIEAIEESTGIKDISIDDAEKVEIGRFDLNGRPISENYHGIAIIRYSDGSTRKIINH